MTEKKDAEKVKVSVTKENSLIIYTSEGFISVLEGSKDQIGKIFRFGKESYKTSVDICQLSQLSGNFLSKIPMENYAKSLNFDIQNDRFCHENS
jgi:tRNA(Leu) C34 or U34 (ribose-2'-O)-methylase TrmL